MAGGIRRLWRRDNLENLGNPGDRKTCANQGDPGSRGKQAPRGKGGLTAREPGPRPDEAGSPSPRRAGTDGARLVLYTRAGCHLCEEADRLLSALAARRGERLTRVEVDTLPADERARYTDLVPVVTVHGREVARWRVDVSAVERALDGP